MKLTTYLVFVMVLCQSCLTDCNEIIERHSNAEKKKERIYPDCFDKSKYTEIVYFENGVTKFSGNFRKNKIFGEGKCWDSDGKLISNTNYKYGIEHGVAHFWYSNGQMSQELTFLDGKENGECKSWYESGELASIGSYSKGLRTGQWSFFELNGGWSIRNYVNDKYQGKSIEHRIDSTGYEFEVVGMYNNGLEEGVWEWVNMDGVIVQKLEYKEGLPDGEFVTYSEFGNIIEKGLFDKGKPVGALKKVDGINNYNGKVKSK